MKSRTPRLRRPLVVGLAATLAVLMLSVGAASAQSGWIKQDGVAWTNPRPGYYCAQIAPDGSCAFMVRTTDGTSASACDYTELLAASREWAKQTSPWTHIALLSVQGDRESGQRWEKIESRWRKAVEACGK